MNQVVKTQTSSPPGPQHPQGGLGFRLGHFLYGLAWRLGGPFLGIYLKRRAKKGKEDLLRLPERRGEASLPRGQTKLLWVHGASVGESLSAIPLIERLLAHYPDIEVLVTTGTVTSAALLKERLPPRCQHQYIPLDHPGYIARFLNRWRPDLIFWLESEFWPGLLKAAADRKIPMALVNARLSDKSFDRWQRRPGLIAPLLSGFEICLAQDTSVAKKLEMLGAKNVSAPGNLKFATSPLPDDAEKRGVLLRFLDNRLLIVAAQTAPGEEEALGRIQLHLRTKFPSLLTVIAPRHTDRSEEIEAALAEQGLAIAVRSRGDSVSVETDIYLADTMGELGLFYRLEAPVFLGRSLFNGSRGSNATEPARLGRPVLQGRHTSDHASTNKLLREAGGLIEIEDDLALCDALEDMIENPDKATEVGAAGQAATQQAADVLERVFDSLQPLLPALTASKEARL